MERRARTAVLTIALIAALAAQAGHGRNRGIRLGATVAVNTHYGAPRDPPDPTVLARLAAAGVAWIRNDLDWAAVERTPGVYDFATPGFDELVAAAEREGLRVLFILDYGNPLHGPARAVVSDAGRRAFAAFAAAAATRYGGRGHAWEIWNEPNLPQFWSGGGARPDPVDYARLVAVAAPALRAADRSGQVLAGSAFMALPAVVRAIGGVPGLEFLEGFFAAEGLAHVDGVTAHFYRAEAPETVAADVTAIRALMSAAGRTVPLWSGEWGYSTYDPAAPPTGVNYLPAVSLERQAAYAARLLLGNHQLGLAGSVYFKDRDAAAAEPGNIEHHFGLMHGDLSPKPAYTAVATLTRLLGDARFQRALALGEGNHGLVFRRRAGRVVALWSERPTTWHLRARCPGVRVLARDGRDVTPAGLRRGALLTLAPDDGPVYVLGPVMVRLAATS
jgi:hypothetical protein